MFRTIRTRPPVCFPIFTGFWGGGFRIVYAFYPDFEEEPPPHCLRIFTGLWREGFRIVNGILPNLVPPAGKNYGLFTDFDRIWGKRLTDCFRNFTE